MEGLIAVLAISGIAGGAAYLIRKVKGRQEAAEEQERPTLATEPETAPSTPPPLPYLGSPELPPGFRLLRLVEPSLTGRDVRAIQQALWEAGFYAGPIHGVFDRETSEALKAFQRARGLAVTGIADAGTWIALGVLVRGARGIIEVAPRYVVKKAGA